MNLHQDKDAFEALLSDVSRRTGIRSDIIEKDYYLTLLLWELSVKQESLPAYFKGGTALYKSIGRMKRFSEDIDLTVAVHDCSKSQGKKRLETSANGYHTLSRTTDKARESNQKGWKGKTLMDRFLKERLSKMDWAFVTKAAMNSFVIKPVDIGG